MEKFQNAEKAFVKCRRDDVCYQVLKRRFQTTQKEFDKELKKSRRSHERSKVYDLEKCNVEYPNEFWKLIAKLGHKKASGIP